MFYRIRGPGLDLVTESGMILKPGEFEWKIGIVWMELECSRLQTLLGHLVPFDVPPYCPSCISFR